MHPKIAIVTGGTRGLGRALSLHFAGAGYRVIAVWNTNAEAADALSDEFRQRGLDGICLRRDLRSTDAFEIPLGEDADEIVFVHNAAAPFQPQPFHLLTASDLEAQWAVAVRGFLFCTHALIRTMLRARRSTVVAVTSRALNGLPPKGFSGYVAAKAGLAALAKSLVSEYGPRGVRVLVVSPGFMRTKLTDAWASTVRDAVARGGESDPDDVARAIVKLVADPSLPGRGEAYEV